MIRCAEVPPGMIGSTTGRSYVTERPAEGVLHYKYVPDVSLVGKSSLLPPLLIVWGTYFGSDLHHSFPTTFDSTPQHRAPIALSNDMALESVVRQSTRSLLHNGVLGGEPRPLERLLLPSSRFPPPSCTIRRAEFGAAGVRVGSLSSSPPK